MNIYQAVRKVVKLVKENKKSKYIVSGYYGYSIVDKPFPSDSHYYLFSPASVEENKAIEYEKDFITGETTKKEKLIAGI